ncbi:MAG: hypothetical protein Q9190_005747 [Brigantiaea leucoxantha]
MEFECPANDIEPPPPPTIVSDGLGTGKKIKKRIPQRNVDEFWDKFTTKFPGKVLSILPANIYVKTKAAQAPKGIIHGRGTARSYDEAAAECRASVRKIAAECRRVNLKFHDKYFDIETDLKRNRRDCLHQLNESENDLDPKSVKRVADIFDDPIFFKDGISANDVRQGFNGDCWFLSALCALSNKPDLINRICVDKDEKVGVYGFVFYRDGEWFQTVIDDKLYLIAADYLESIDDKRTWEDVRRADPEEEYRKANQTSSRALYFAQCSDQNETWLPLLEKAFAKAHGDYSAIDGGFTGEAIEDLTGGVTTELLTTDILDTDRFWADEIMKVNQDFLFGCATGRFDKWQGSEDADTNSARKGVVRMHAYSIMEAREVKGERLLRVRNPWGNTEWQGAWSDGSEQWTPEWMQLLDHKFGDDGMFWISYKDLLRKYSYFDRTRLFGPEWQITQQWTSVDVPWTADYNDTTFKIKVTEAGPVVISLSQLDSRYFRGLEGQYTFQLHFRLEKDGESGYIIRSHGNYSMSRSASTDIELDPGTYTVLMKIIAKRWTGDPIPEEVIRKCCMDRQEKLIRTGLSYDLAHAKGQIRESEKEKQARAAREEKKKAADHTKRRAELRAQMLKDWETGRKRLARMKRHAKRKEEYFKKKAETEQVATEETIGGLEGTQNTEEGNDPTTEAVAEEQTTLAGSEPENIEAPVSEAAAPPSPPPEEGIAENDETTGEAAAGEEGAAEETQEPENAPAGPNDEEAPPADDANPPGVEENDEWEYASDASFNSSIVTDLDFPPEDPSADNAETSPAPEDGEDEDAAFADDPWNAVCVVGLRVYSKDKGLSVEVVRPKSKDDEADIPLDVDDASKGASVETAQNKAE